MNEILTLHIELVNSTDALQRHREAVVSLIFGLDCTRIEMAYYKHVIVASFDGIASSSLTSTSRFQCLASA